MEGPLATITVAAARAAILLVGRLPRELAFWRIGGQLFDSATSQAANYRAARRARSTREFIAKLKIVEEESDEASFWIDRLFDAALPRHLQAEARSLQDQLAQVRKITVSSIKTARARLEREQKSKHSSFVARCSSLLRYRTVRILASIRSYFAMMASHR